MAGVALGVGMAGGVACGEDGSPGAGERLAERVAAALAADPGAVTERLAQFGLPADAELDAESLTCPAVDDARPGDRATCTAPVDGTEVAVEVEFGDADALRVVGITTAP